MTTPKAFPGNSPEIRSFKFRDIDLRDGLGRLPDCQLRATNVLIKHDMAGDAEGGYGFVATIGTLACQRHLGSNCPVAGTLRNADDIEIGFRATAPQLDEIITAAQAALNSIVLCDPLSTGGPAHAA